MSFFNDSKSTAWTHYYSFYHRDKSLRVLNSLFWSSLHLSQYKKGLYLNKLDFVIVCPLPVNLNLVTLIEDFSRTVTEAVKNRNAQRKTGSETLFDESWLLIDWRPNFAYWVGNHTAQKRKLVLKPWQPTMATQWHFQKHTCCCPECLAVKNTVTLRLFAVFGVCAVLNS